MNIALSRVHFPVTTLGPGRRVGIWFQGCSIRCPGCISVDTWVRKKAGVSVLDLLDSISAWLAHCDGVTISGGEPFEQPQALAELLEGIRGRAGCDVLVYSGFAFEQLKQHPLIDSGLIDALISDPFLLDAPQTKALRGSDNQRLHLLTKRGTTAFAGYERASEQQDKRLDVMFDADGVVWFAGIPSRGDIGRLQQLLATRGDVVTTTESRS